VYGTSSYDGFPYRHPFVTLHNVIHDDDGARLGEGQLATPDMLIHLMVSLGRSVPVEILPERVLVRTADMIVWWSPATDRTMFFSDRGGDATLQRLNGKRFPHPALVFKACGRQLSIRALAKNERPSETTRLSVAPYWNCNDQGFVCTGSMKIPREKSVKAIESWEQSFFQSEFTHAAGGTKQTQFPGGFLAMWLSLARKKEFPSEYLMDATQVLSEFVQKP
jgi:PRTRC genetic system protein B